jgi:hypothetical protein
MNPIAASNELKTKFFRNSCRDFGYSREVVSSHGSQPGRSSSS